MAVMYEYELSAKAFTVTLPCSSFIMETLFWYLFDHETSSSAPGEGIIEMVVLLPNSSSISVESNIYDVLLPELSAIVFYIKYQWLTISFLSTLLPI